jgi:hypothetical protein
VSRTRYRRWSGNRSSDSQQALRHIEEGRELSLVLGGTDRIVKNFLFNLQGEALASLITEYGKKYGSLRREYAEETLPKWRSGRVQMSGVVAARFYAVLPPQMPLALKYEIAEQLWKHVGPSSQATLRFGDDASPDELLIQISDYIESVVDDYTIPNSLSQTFDWLSSEDVQLKQQLLNHLRKIDKDLVVQAGDLQVGVMLRHRFGENTEYIGSFTHVLSAGKHELTLVADPKTSGFVLENRRVTAVKEVVLPTGAYGRFARSRGRRDKTDKNEQIVCWIIAIIVVIVIFALNWG